MSGVSTPSFRLSRTITRDGAAQPTKRALVQLGPDLRARLPHQQPHRFARVAQRQDEEPRAPVLARLRIADHRALAVVDLAFLAGRRRDDDARLGRRASRAACTTKRRTLAYRAREAVVVDQVLPDRHRVAPAAERLDDQLAIRLAGARARRARGDGPESVDTAGGEIAGFAGRGRWTPPAEMAGFAGRFARTAAAPHRQCPPRAR